MPPCVETETITPHDLKENFYALFLSVYLDYTPEQSFSHLGCARSNQRKNLAITDEDIRDMATLKERLTYSQVGELYNMTGFAVYNRIRRYRGKIK